MTISKLLVANRGEIAARVLRTAKARGLATAVLRHVAEQEGPAHLIASFFRWCLGFTVYCILQLSRGPRPRRARVWVRRHRGMATRPRSSACDAFRRARGAERGKLELSGAPRLIFAATL